MLYSGIKVQAYFQCGVLACLQHGFSITGILADKSYNLVMIHGATYIRFRTLLFPQGETVAIFKIDIHFSHFKFASVV